MKPNEPPIIAEVVVEKKTSNENTIWLKVIAIVLCCFLGLVVLQGMASCSRQMTIQRERQRRKDLNPIGRAMEDTRRSIRRDIDGY